jgi:hypothetical protein
MASCFKASMVMCWKMLVGRLEKTGFGIRDLDYGFQNTASGCGSGLQSGSRLFGSPRQAGVIIIQASCLEIGLSFCLPFRLLYKSLNLLCFFDGQTGTSPAKALT